MNLKGVYIAIFISSSISAVSFTHLIQSDRVGGVFIFHFIGIYHLPVFTRWRANDLRYVECGSEEWCRRYCAGVKFNVNVVILEMCSCTSFQNGCIFRQDHQMCSKDSCSEPHFQQRGEYVGENSLNWVSVWYQLVSNL